jgi:superfamily II DNA/RNA helicase
LPNLPAEPAADPGTVATTTVATTHADLGMAPALVQLASLAGWVTPTPIQVAAIPAVLSGADLLALAPTGSGKTAAFLLPLLQRLLAEPGWREERWLRVRALIMAPTRELAAQIADAVRGLAPQLKTVVAVGGVSINPQMMALRGGAHLVVATPGRLLDLIDHNALRLADLRVLVLDEADRLLDLGFADELERLLALMPRQRQTLMFSATMPEAVAELAAAILDADAVRVDVRGHRGAAPDIAQRAIEVDTAQRTPLLRHLIAAGNWDQVLVFVATQYASEHVADKLRRSGIAAAALHGQLSQGRRSEVLADFQDHQLRVLVATDLAARGLDIVGLPVVVNHDLPRSAVDYTHRIGRTGRADLPGLAISFVCADAPGSEAHFRLIEKRQQLRVAREQIVGFEPADLALPPAPVDTNGGVKGKRKSKKDKLREEAAALAAAAARAPRRR